MAKPDPQDPDNKSWGGDTDPYGCAGAPGRRPPSCRSTMTRSSAADRRRSHAADCAQHPAHAAGRVRLRAEAAAKVTTEQQRDDALPTA